MTNESGRLSAVVGELVASMLSIAPTCESDWDEQLREWAAKLKSVQATLSALTAGAGKGEVVLPETEHPENPWREFIENCISGGNYFRASEYHVLLRDLDRGLHAIDALSTAAWLVRNHATGSLELAEPNEKASNPEHWSDAFPVYTHPDAPVGVSEEVELPPMPEPALMTHLGKLGYSPTQLRAYAVTAIAMNVGEPQPAAHVSDLIAKYEVREGNYYRLLDGENAWARGSHQQIQDFLADLRALTEGSGRVTDALPFTDATIDKLQDVMAFHGFAVPVRVISDAFRTAMYCAALNHAEKGEG